MPRVRAKYLGERSVHVFDVWPWKVVLDPEEGSVSCECPEHARFVVDQLNVARCSHAGLVWRLFHQGGIL